MPEKKGEEQKYILEFHPQKLKLNMNKDRRFYNKLGRCLWNSLAILLILLGVFAALTPLTPGSWLFFVGLFMIFGRKKTRYWVERLKMEPMGNARMMGKKLFQKFGVGRLLRKLPKIK